MSVIFTVMVLLSAAFPGPACAKTGDIPIWTKFEHTFTSSRDYGDPLYDVSRFAVTFTAPSGREKTVRGFWDGGRSWKVRFMPDETGEWRFVSACSDDDNTGLHGAGGSFVCVEGNGGSDVLTRGAVSRMPGAYHLAHADGTPFLWLGDTAWNGALKSTPEEWERYLSHRRENGFSVIQFVTTQWRGCEGDRFGRTAISGSGHIAIDLEFFRRMDEKIDRINDHGLVAAPVLLWALHFVSGRYLSPGYYLPQEEAILLARYMVARFGGNHVVWILGGDGKYTDEFEQRWKIIGRGVFADGEHQGPVTTHPMGRSWYGGIYRDEDWLDIVGYQSSHSTRKETVEFITRGPAAAQWKSLPPRPVMNQEPVYEFIRPGIGPRDIRNACWWSVFATPVSGVTFGSNGIWPWLREGEEILNHRKAPNVPTWDECLDAPGSVQFARLGGFLRRYEWWRLRPAQHLVAEQPGDDDHTAFISVSATDRRDIIMAYVPKQSPVIIFNALRVDYRGQWFDPSDGGYLSADIVNAHGVIETEPPKDTDLVLVLESVR